ncbi:MAG TPA: hypothetical protein VFW96_14060 [Thermomicrobiales bacterium]|nr:hypothetical protein [Thermomicrobiales bacterium]
MGGAGDGRDEVIVTEDDALTAALAGLRAAGEPLTIAVPGQAPAVALPVERYEWLLWEAGEAAALRDVLAAAAEADRGEAIPHERVAAALERRGAASPGEWG